MSDVEVLATRASDGLRRLLGRFASVAFGLAVAAAVVGLAAYGSGHLATDGSFWPVGGIVICFLPAALALLAWWRIKRAQRVGPRAFADLRTVLQDEQRPSSVQVLIDGDTGRQIVTSSRSMNDLLVQLKARRQDWPALVDTLSAVATVPALVVLAIVGMLLVGAIGTVLLLIGLIG